MKKTAIVLVVFSLLLFNLSASPYFDFALMLGQGNYTWPPEGIGVSYGASFGITDKMEVNLWGVSEVIPVPFSSNVLCAEVSYALLGQRNTGSKVSGININTIISLGGFYRTDDKGAGVMLGITPLSVGSPSLTKRERCLRTNIGWDFRNSRLLVMFSPMDVEIYFKGTYRDWI